jgi:hypothetical protein
MDRKSPPRVELLWFADCPNHEAVRESVRAILDEVAPEAEFADLDATDPTLAARLHFPGSPTVRVNGVDVEPGFADPGDTRRAAACTGSTAVWLGPPTRGGSATRWLRAAGSPTDRSGRAVGCRRHGRRAMEGDYYHVRSRCLAAPQRRSWKGSVGRRDASLVGRRWEVSEGVIPMLSRRRAPQRGDAPVTVGSGAHCIESPPWRRRPTHAQTTRCSG